VQGSSELSVAGIRWPSTEQSLRDAVHAPPHTCTQRQSHAQPGKSPLQCYSCASVLWHCWLDVRKSSGLWKLSDEVFVWLSVWSKVQIVCIWSSWCHCHPTTPSSLASFKTSRLFLPFWYRLTQVVLEKRPLNRCSSSMLPYQGPCGLEAKSFGLSLSLTLSDLGLVASGLGLIEIGLVASNIYSAHDIN